MVWKVNELKQWLDLYDDNDVVDFCKYNYGAEAYVTPTDVALRMRRPKKDEFYHKDCIYCDIIHFNGCDRVYCKRQDLFMNYDTPKSQSCDNFKHVSNQVSYCLNCQNCNWNYGNCNGIIGGNNERRAIHKE